MMITIPTMIPATRPVKAHFHSSDVLGNLKGKFI